jgi:hypothetical protein
MINKKIKNATSTEFNGIKFKSKSEVMVYKTLLQEGFKPNYEPTKYIIWEGFKPSVLTYKPDKSGELVIQNKKLIDITYTPDFLFVAPDNKTLVILEVKGFCNDLYPVKEKMFRKFLEELSENYNQPVVFFQIKTKKQLLQAIKIINENFKKNE